MFKKIKKIFGHLLTVLILLQFVLCFFLMFRTAKGQDMAIFGYRFYYIVSPSMEPVIEVGSEIVVKEVDIDTLKEKDIITFESRDPSIKGYPNTHRIQEITMDEAGKKAFITKGDNNKLPDEYLVYPEDIYGKVVAIAPAWEGLIRFYSFAATPTGFMVVVIMPLLLLFTGFFRSLLREMKEASEEAKQQVISDEKSQNNGILINETAMQEMLAAVIRTYKEEHPGQEITPEEAAKLAAGLAAFMEGEANQEKGEE